MTNLHTQLKSAVFGRTCLIGLGNTEHGDDGVGVRLAEALEGIRGADGLWMRVLIGGLEPERVIGRIITGEFNNVIFLDAVDFGAIPGSVVLLTTPEISARFPQISTHKLSLTVLAHWIEAGGKTKVWVLGVQPGSLRFGSNLSPAVRQTLEILIRLFNELSTEGKIPVGAHMHQTHKTDRKNLC